MTGPSPHCVVFISLSGESPQRPYHLDTSTNYTLMLLRLFLTNWGSLLVSRRPLHYCLCLLEKKKSEILFETWNWSVKFPAVINFKIHFDFSVLKAKSPPGWQEEFMFDGLEGIASLRTGLRSSMMWWYLRDTFSSYRCDHIWKYNHYRPKKCV